MDKRDALISGSEHQVQLDVSAKLLRLAAACLMESSDQEDILIAVGATPLYSNCLAGLHTKTICKCSTRPPRRVAPRPPPRLAWQPTWCRSSSTTCHSSSATTSRRSSWCTRSATTSRSSSSSAAATRFYHACVVSH